MQKLFLESEDIVCPGCHEKATFTPGSWYMPCPHCNKELLRSIPFGFKYVRPACDRSLAYDLVDADDVYHCRLCLRDHRILFHCPTTVSRQRVYLTSVYFLEKNPLPFEQLALIRLLEMEARLGETKWMEKELEDRKKMVELLYDENVRMREELEMNKKVKEELKECRRAKGKLEESLKNAEKTILDSVEKIVTIKEELEMTKKTSEEAIERLMEEFSDLRMSYLKEMSEEEKARNQADIEMEKLAEELEMEQQKNDELKEELELMNGETRMMDVLVKENEFLADSWMFSNILQKNVVAG